MPDYTQWPTSVDVQQMLDSAGVTLRITASEADARTGRLMAAVEQDIARRTMRQFVADAPAGTSRYFDGTGTAELEIDEFVAFTSATVIGIATAPGYGLVNVIPITEAGRPQTRLIMGQGSVPAWTTEGVVVPYAAVFPLGRSNIEIVAQFGYGATIPANLWEACAAEVAHRLTQEVLFRPVGRIQEQQRADIRIQYKLSEAAATGWHQQFETACRQYRRATGRRLRNLTPRMI